MPRPVIVRSSRRRRMRSSSMTCTALPWWTSIRGPARSTVTLMRKCCAWTAKCSAPGIRPIPVPMPCAGWPWLATKGRSVSSGAGATAMAACTGTRCSSSARASPASTGFSPSPARSVSARRPRAPCAPASSSTAPSSAARWTASLAWMPRDVSPPSIRLPNSVLVMPLTRCWGSRWPSC
ncbi:hypothetical protein D3C86_1629330 [compost metagenome]